MNVEWLPTEARLDTEADGKEDVDFPSSFALIDTFEMIKDDSVLRVWVMG